MQLLHLSLENFRLFTRLDMAVPSGMLVLVGGNAQGKTSLLEAVYLLATLASFQAESDRELIHFSELEKNPAVARVVAEFRRETEKKPHRLEIRIIQERNGSFDTPRLRKEVLFDGAKQKAAEALGHFNAVLFLPQMLRIIDGPPEERRRYLNLALAQVVRGFSGILSSYGRLLTQRNALLKQLSENGGDPSQLDFWDKKISAAGAQIISERIQAVQELGLLCARIHRTLTRGSEILRLDYRPSYDPLPRANGQYALNLPDPRDRSHVSLEEIRGGFARALLETRSEQIARGVTTFGPHRDELRFLSNRIDLGVFGSRGQVRTALLSLKLAELEWMRLKTGDWPVLLLDEVLAELDLDRRADLLSRVLACEQALLTTTDLNLFEPGFVEQAKLWEIEGGRISTQRDFSGYTYAKR